MQATSTDTNLIKSILKSESVNDTESSIINDYDFSVLQSPTNININNVGELIFVAGSKWKDRTLIRNAVNSYASIAGFSVFHSSEYIRCSRFGEPKKKSSRDFLGGQLKCGCSFSITLASSQKVKQMPKKISSSSKPKYRANWDDNVPVIIKKANCKHSGLCKPSPQQQLFSRSRSGQYIKAINETALFTLCNFFKHNKRLKSTTIRSVLKPIWPQNKNITKHDIYNMRVRVKRLLPILDRCASFENFQNEINATALLSGLDSKDITDDEIYSLADEIWQDVMNDNIDDDGEESSLVSFTDYLKILSDKAPGFVYDLAYDSKGTINGAVWQTATMRDNFERFGGFICLDVMKRGINKLLWPYSAVAMYNDLEQVCSGYELILVVDWFETISYLTDFVNK